MALYRILTTIAAIFLSLIVVTAWSFPASSNKYPMENKEGLYNDLFQALSQMESARSNSRSRHPAGTYVDGFGATKHHPLNDKDIQQFSWLFNGDLKDDIGKRDYNDLGFFFGKRANSATEEKDTMQRQSRDYGDLGMFFGKRNGNDITEERNMEFPDFAA